MIRASFAAIFSLCSCMALAADSQPVNAGSLEPALKEAQELSRSAEQSAAAIQVYEGIVQTHLANQKHFHDALRELADTYEKAGKAEDGVRFFYKLGQQMEAADSNSLQAIRRALGQFLSRHTDLVTKVSQEMQGSSSRRPAPAMPSLEIKDAILQRENAALRDESVNNLLAMLEPTSSDKQKKSGLSTLIAVKAAKFDRKPFLPLVMPLLKHEDPDLRCLALVSMSSLEPPAEDLPAIANMAKDPDARVRMEVAGALVLSAKEQHAEVVIPALLQLLQDQDQSVVERSLRSIWGQYSSPDLDRVLIRLSNEPQHENNAIYFGLSTMKSKSPEVCQRLVEELADPDWNNSGRAAWGLNVGVPETAKEMVEQGLLKALPQETNEYTRLEELKALRTVASEKSRPYLQSVVNSSMEKDEIKEAARKALARLDKKPN